MGKASRKKKKAETAVVERQTPGLPAFGINWAHVAIIALVCVAVYANTLTMGYIWDDNSQIHGRGIIHSLGNIPKFFTNEVWVGTAGSHGSPYYRPLFNVSLALDYFFWKENLFGYHLTNILLHLLATVALYFVALRIFKSDTVAFVAALLFAVHPVHSDAVAWVSARNEPFCAALMFIAFYAYLRFREGGGLKTLFAALAVFSLSLLVKETAVTLPIIILLYELCMSEGPIGKRVIWPAIFCLAAIPYFLIRLAIIGSTLAGNIDPFPTRLFTSFVLFGVYLEKLVLPTGLKLYYDIPIQKTFFAWHVVGSFAILAVIAALTGIYARKNRPLLFSILWVFATLLPVSGLPVIIKPAPMAERYLYIPSAGFAMAVGWWFSALLNRLAAMQSGPAGRRRPSLTLLGKVAGVALIVLLFIMNFRRNFDWTDNLSFAEKRVKDAPNSEVVRNELGIEYLSRHMNYKASAAFEEAIAIKPNFGEAFFNLGLLHQERGEIDIAQQYFNNAILLKPEFPDPKVSLGLMHIVQQQYREAGEYLQAALRLRPKDPNAMYGMGLVSLYQGKKAEGERYLLQVLDIDPEYTDAHNALGVYYLKTGNMEKALAHLESACRFRPERKDFRQNLEIAREMQKKS